ncbi:MAG TPA: hypothetical protein VF857_08985, partial [Spirochaetota bacterium]
MPAIKTSMHSSGSGTVSYGYYYLQSEINNVKNVSFNIAMNMVFIDEAINGLSPSATANPAKSILITEAVRDKIAALIPDGFDKAELTSMLDSWIGLSYPISEFYYQSLTGDPDYAFQFSGNAGSEDVIICWSADKTRIKVVHTRNPDSPAVMRDVFINDSTAKTTQVYYISGSQIIVMVMKGDGDAINNTFISQDCTDVVSGYHYSIEGVADDNGGAAICKKYYLSWSDFALHKDSYVECFDNAGNMTYQNIGGTVSIGSDSDPAVV